MFDKRLWWTGAALAVTVAFSLFLSELPEPGGTVPLQEPVPGIARKAERVEEESGEEQEYAYLLREYEGKIAVFTPGGTEPQMVFDVLVKFLPDYDRVQMKNGIPVRDFEALSAIIEDYIS